MQERTSANLASDDPPNAVSSWAAVVAIGVGAFAIVTSEFLPVGLLPEIARDLGITEGQGGLMVTLPGVIAAFAAPLTIAYAGHIDRRRLLWILLALLAISNVIVSTSTSVAAVLCGRVLLGIALGGFWTIAGSLGPRLRRGAQGTRATAVIFSGISVGTVAGVPIGVYVGTLFGWRAAFSATAAIAAVVVIALLVLLPAIPPQRSSGLKAVPELLTRPLVRIALAATVLVFAGQFAAYTYITPFLLQTTQVSATALSAFLFAFGITGFFGNLYGGWASGRNTRLAVACAALLLCFSITLLTTTGGNVWMAAISVAVWGFAFGMSPVALQTFTLNSAPDHLEAAAALLVFFLQIALGVGSFAGGVAADHFSSVGAFAIGMAATLLAFALVLSSLIKSKGA